MSAASPSALVTSASETGSEAGSSSSVPSGGEGAREGAGGGLGSGRRIWFWGIIFVYLFLDHFVLNLV